MTGVKHHLGPPPAGKPKADNYEARPDKVKNSETRSKKYLKRYKEATE